MELVRSVNGTAIEETITTADGKQILLNAQVNTESVETIQQYQYEVLPVTDELRETLFTTFFGARASEAIYDQRNDVWELHNSEAIGDYYLYEHTIAMAGESVPGEEIFTLGYRNTPGSPASFPEEIHRSGRGTERQSGAALRSKGREQGPPAEALFPVFLPQCGGSYQAGSSSRSPSMTAPNAKCAPLSGNSRCEASPSPMMLEAAAPACALCALMSLICATKPSA